MSGEADYLNTAGAPLAMSPSVVSPPPVKRPARTYGRKKSPVADLDASFTSDYLATTSESSVFQTAPPNLDEFISASSGNDEEEDAVPFQYAWKKKLQELDSDSDDERNEKVSKAFGRPTLLRSQSPPAGRRKREPSAMKGPVVIHDLFSSGCPMASPSTESSTRQRDTTPPLFLSNDSDDEHPKTSPLTNTSPADLHLLNTPNSRSSTTPPTTDGEASSSRLKKKNYTDDRRRSIPPPPSPVPLGSRRVSTEGRTKSRVKKPTKKDMKETTMERARLTNEKEVTIQAHVNQIFTLENLFSTINPAAAAAAAKLPVRDHCFQSDPIQPFSSSPPNDPFHTGGSKLAQVPVEVEDIMLSLSDDGDLPDTAVLLNMKKPAQQKPKVDSAELRKRKEKLLLNARKATSSDNDDDDDLEIISESPKIHKSAEKRRVSRLRKAQMQLAGVNYVKSQKTQSSSVSKGKAPLQSREKMNQGLWQRAKQEFATTIEEKEKAWKEIGGRVQEHVGVEGGPESVVKALAERGLKAAEEKVVHMDTESDSDDDDWVPDNRGSTSPRNATAELTDEEHHDTVPSAEGDGALTEGDEEEENARIPRRHRRKAIVDSDDENDENAQPPSRQPRPSRLDERSLDMDVEHDSFTPFSEDGTDKENNHTLRFDRSEDKENKAVMRFPSESSDIFTPLQPLGSLSFSQDTQPRRPFQELPSSSEESQPKELGRRNLTQMFEAQLNEPRKTPELQLEPFLARKSPGGFSQFSEPGDEVTLRRDRSSQNLADLFEATTQASGPSSPNKLLLEEAFAEKPNNDLRGLGRADTLDLTQDLLQPAFRPRQDLLQKANDILEKEQGFVLDSAFDSENNKPDLYVNDYGFLTQTRPNVPNPEVYRPPSPAELRSQSSALATPLEPRSSHRSPLATLSFSDPVQGESPPLGQLKRLRKRSQSPSERVVETSAKKRRNAFDMLNDGARKEADRKRQRLDKSEFVEGEAEESDDEAGFWGPKKKEEDEEMEDEDLDKTLEGLVDDQEMDDDTLAAGHVFEKFKEQEQLDDQKIEESAKNVVEGEWRKKRKDGGFMNDESDEEDDEQRRLRSKYRRQQKKRADVEALEANDSTKAFAKTYASTLADDDENDFKHLAEDQTEQVLARVSVLDGNGDEEDEDYGDEDDDEDVEMSKPISDRDLREQLRLRRENPDEFARIDPNDTTWLEDLEEEDGDEMEINVRTAKPAVKPTRVQQLQFDPSDMDDGPESQDGNQFSADVHQFKKAQSWAKREGRNRNTTTARAGSAAAVTNLRVKSGGGSLRRQGGSKEPAAETPKLPVVKKAVSMVMNVDRSSRFK
ncbi:hypothetical protein FA15DRAFT_752712 [Coprinopsis marcescibilis]|uniref:DNA replication checkpoint mediator MRC1 domain-containing protein n=1 Tax=Coprinopsis marcescibilis TaxID=230819 RepID=A0A5C3LKQ1_COPMA|nr:hypothetical protein FA15DRAFT_752712 [Coprinopsis marcescibilis]